MTPLIEAKRLHHRAETLRADVFGLWDAVTPELAEDPSSPIKPSRLSVALWRVNSLLREATRELAAATAEPTKEPDGIVRMLDADKATNNAARIVAGIVKELDNV